MGSINIEIDKPSLISESQRRTSAYKRFHALVTSINSYIKFKNNPRKLLCWFTDKNDSHQSIDNIRSAYGKSKFVVDPHSRHYFLWLIIVSLAIFYNLIFIIGRAVFWEMNNRLVTLWLYLDYSSDVIYAIDTIIRFHEGYLEEGIMVRNIHKLRLHYFKSKNWIFDLISFLPTDVAYYWWHPSQCHIRIPCPVIVRINRLVRLPRLYHCFYKAETNATYPNFFRICKVLLLILVLIHWNACLYFTISYVIGFGSDKWVYDLNGSISSTLSTQYITCFYWSTLVLTTIGEVPTPRTDIEHVFMVIDYLSGVLIFAIIIGNISSVISNMQIDRLEFQYKIDNVKKYMNSRRVSNDLALKVIKWLEYTYTKVESCDELKVLSYLPDKFKAEIAINVHLETIRKVAIFRDCNPGFLEALVLKLKLQVFSPGDYVCRKGDIGKEMYIVKRGLLEVVCNDGMEILACLEAGSVFGELSVLDIAGNRRGNRRTASVRSMGYSDVFCLEKNDLLDTLTDYPEVMASLIERGARLLKKDGLLNPETSQNDYSDGDVFDRNGGQLKKIQGLLTDINRNIEKNQQIILGQINGILNRSVNNFDS